jgi:hypothetical protein
MRDVGLRRRTFAAASCRGEALCGATPLGGDRLRVDQPLSFTGPLGMFLLGAAEAADAQKATNFRAGGVHQGGSLLGGEPTVVNCGHRKRSSGAREGAR